jgi:hypothetical protein
MRFKKLLSITVILCFTFSFILKDALYAVLDVKIESEQHSPALEDFVIPQSYGRVTDFESLGSKQIVVNIQDLHCNPEVQRNIAKILSSLDEKYGLKNIYVEGGYGKVDTSWFCDITNKDLKKEIVENLVDQGKLTGSEYYSVKSSRPDLLRGLEDEAVHKANIIRLGKILQKKPYFEAKLKLLHKDLEFMKIKYFSSKSMDLNKLVERRKAGNITADKYYGSLVGYVRQLNNDPNRYSNLFSINMENYPNLNAFLELNNLSRQIEYKKLSVQLQQFIQLLKSKVPYSAYNSLLQKTDNFSKIDELYLYLDKMAKTYKLDLDTNFAQLKKFFEYSEKSRQLNPVKLVGEEQRLVEELRFGFAQNKSELEVSFLADFYSYFQDFILNQLSAEDYDYFNKRFDKFKLIWEKYAFINRVKELSGDFDLLSGFYKANCQRNFCFLKNIEPLNGNPVSALSVSSSTVSGIEELLHNSEIVVVVTGGFHTAGLKNLLQEKKISRLTITPNVTHGTESSSETYSELAVFQSKILSNSMQLGLLAQLPFTGKVMLELKAVKKKDILKLLQEIEKTGIKVDIKQSKVDEGIFVFDNGSKINLKEKEGNLEASVEPGERSGAFKEAIKAFIDVEKLALAVEKALLGQVDDLVTIVAAFAAEHYLVTGNGLIPEILTDQKLSKAERIGKIKTELLARFPEVLQKAYVNEEKEIGAILNEHSDWLRILLAIDLLRDFVFNVASKENEMPAISEIAECIFDHDASWDEPSDTDNWKSHAVAKMLSYFQASSDPRWVILELYNGEKHAGRIHFYGNADSYIRYVKTVLSDAQVPVVDASYEIDYWPLDQIKRIIFLKPDVRMPADVVSGQEKGSNDRFAGEEKINIENLRLFSSRFQGEFDSKSDEYSLMGMIREIGEKLDQIDIDDQGVRDKIASKIVQCLNQLTGKTWERDDIQIEGFADDKVFASELMDIMAAINWIFVQKKEVPSELHLKDYPPIEAVVYNKFFRNDFDNSATGKKIRNTLSGLFDIQSEYIGGSDPYEARLNFVKGIRDRDSLTALIREVMNANPSTIKKGEALSDSAIASRLGLPKDDIWEHYKDFVEATRIRDSGGDVEKYLREILAGIYKKTQAAAEELISKQENSKAPKPVDLATQVREIRGKIEDLQKKFSEDHPIRKVFKRTIVLIDQKKYKEAWESLKTAQQLATDDYNRFGLGKYAVTVKPVSTEELVKLFLMRREGGEQARKAEKEIKKIEENMGKSDAELDTFFRPMKAIDEIKLLLGTILEESGQRLAPEDNPRDVLSEALDIVRRYGGPPDRYDPYKLSDLKWMIENEYKGSGVPLTAQTRAHIDLVLSKLKIVSRKPELTSEAYKELMKLDEPATKGHNESAHLDNEDPSTSDKISPMPTADDMVVNEQYNDGRPIIEPEMGLEKWNASRALQFLLSLEDGVYDMSSIVESINELFSNERNQIMSRATVDRLIRIVNARMLTKHLTLDIDLLTVHKTPFQLNTPAQAKEHYKGRKIVFIGGPSNITFDYRTITPMLMDLLENLREKDPDIVIAVGTTAFGCGKQIIEAAKELGIEVISILPRERSEWVSDADYHVVIGKDWTKDSYYKGIAEFTDEVFTVEGFGGTKREFQAFLHAGKKAFRLRLDNASTSREKWREAADWGIMSDEEARRLIHKHYDQFKDSEGKLDALRLHQMRQELLETYGLLKQDGSLDHTAFYKEYILRASNTTKDAWLKDYEVFTSFIDEVEYRITDKEVIDFAFAIHDNGYWRDRLKEIHTKDVTSGEYLLLGRLPVFTNTSDEKTFMGYLTDSGKLNYENRFQKRDGYKIVLEDIKKESWAEFYQKYGAEKNQASLTRFFAKADFNPAKLQVYNANAGSWNDLLDDAAFFDGLKVAEAQKLRSIKTRQEKESYLEAIGKTARLATMRGKQKDGMASAFALTKVNEALTFAQMDYATAVIWRYKGHWRGRDGWEQVYQVSTDYYSPEFDADRSKDGPIWQAVLDRELELLGVSNPYERFLRIVLMRTTNESEYAIKSSANIIAKRIAEVKAELAAEMKTKMREMTEEELSNIIITRILSKTDMFLSAMQMSHSMAILRRYVVRPEGSPPVTENYYSSAFNTEREKMSETWISALRTKTESNGASPVKSFVDVVLRRSSNESEFAWKSTFKAITDFMKTLEKSITREKLEQLGPQVHDNGYWAGEKKKIDDPNSAFLGSHLNVNDKAFLDALSADGRIWWENRNNADYLKKFDELKAQGKKPRGVSRLGTGGYQFTSGIFENVETMSAYYRSKGKTEKAISEAEKGGAILNENAMSAADLLETAKLYPGELAGKRLEVFLNNQRTAIATALLFIDQDLTLEEMAYLAAVLWRYIGHWEGEKGYDNVWQVNQDYLMGLDRAEREKDVAIILAVFKLYGKKPKGPEWVMDNSVKAEFLDENGLPKFCDENLELQIKDRVYLKINLKWYPATIIDYRGDLLADGRYDANGGLIKYYKEGGFMVRLDQPVPGEFIPGNIDFLDKTLLDAERNQTNILERRVLKINTAMQAGLAKSKVKSSLVWKWTEKGIRWFVNGIWGMPLSETGERRLEWTIRIIIAPVSLIDIIGHSYDVLRGKDKENFARKLWGVKWIWGTTIAVGIATSVFGLWAIPAAYLANVFVHMYYNWKNQNAPLTWGPLARTTPIFIKKMKASDKTPINHVISSDDLAEALGKFREQVYFTDSDKITDPGKISHLAQLDFVIPKEYTRTGMEDAKVSVCVGVDQGSIVFYMDVKGADAASYAQILRLGEAEILKQLREENTPAIERVRSFVGSAKIMFGSGVTVDHFKTGNKMAYNDTGSLVVSRDFFEKNGTLDENTISIKTGDAMVIRNGESWAMGEAILTNLDDVENINDFKKSLKATTKIGNGLMVVKPSVLDAIGKKKTTAIAKLVRTSGAELYLNLLDFSLSELNSKKDFYKDTGVSGYIYTGSDGGLKLYDYASQTEKDVDAIRNYGNMEDLSNGIRRSKATFKMLFSSDLRKLLKGGLRDVDERGSLIEVLKSTLLSLYDPQELTTDFVQNVAFGWNWEKLPQLAPEKYKEVINAIENKEALQDILAKMGLGDGVSHSIKTYIEDKLTGDVKGTPKEVQLDQLQRDFVKGIIKNMLVKEKLIAAHKVNGLTDVELTRILGNKLYEQIEKNTIGAGVLMTSQEFIERVERENVKTTAPEFFAKLSTAVRNLSADPGPKAINTIIELVLVADSKPRLIEQKKPAEVLNMNAIDQILGAG